MKTDDKNSANHVPFLVVVETWRDSNWRESVRTIDHNKHEERIWLAKHCFWALHNDRAVVTYPAVANFRFMTI